MQHLNEKKKVEKEIQTLIKQQAKKQGFNVVSNCIYKIIDNYFIYSVFWIQKNESNWKLYLRMNIKPYNYDNLFWEIFDMADNVNAKDSLRANGAFICPSIQWHEKPYELGHSEHYNTEIVNAILDFQKETDEFIFYLNEKYPSFNSFVVDQQNILDEKLLKMIANISEGDYSLACKMADNEVIDGNRGGYKNKGKDIYEYIIEYCKKRIKN
jgi:hypothetical protein